MSTTLRKHTVAIACDGTGAATVYVGPLSGKVHMIKYNVGTMHANTDLTITGNDSATPVITVTNAGASSLFLYPRASLVTVANAAITDSHGPVWVLNEKIKCVVADGGASGAGSLDYYIDES